MGERGSGPHLVPTGKSAPSARLYSWKEIAAHFGRDERTVRRWEKAEGLPVHRLQHAKSGSVFADVAELDAWAAKRTSGVQTAQPARRRSVLWLVVVLPVAGLVATVWFALSLRAPPVSIPAGVALTSDPGIELEPALSADASQVAYVWNGDTHDNFDVYVRPVAGRSERRLTNDPAHDHSPAWSPDGASIAVLRQTAAMKSAVLIMPALGGAERMVAEIATGPWLHWHRPGPFLTWSPDGKSLIAVGRTGPHNVDRLLKIAVAGGQVTPVTSPPATTMGDSGPAISPDGKMLAFSRQNSWGVSELCLVPLSPDLMPAGEARKLDTGSSWNASPAWMPDGRTLIFSSGRMDHAHLSKIDTSAPARAVALAEVGDYGWHPSVMKAPGGNVRLVYTRHFESVNIWKQTLRGMGRVMQIVTSAHWSYEPDYSPDGKRIAFLSDRSGDVDVWVAGADGRNPRQWTFLQQSSLGAPRWSPDSQRIAFTVPGPDGSSIYLIDGPGMAPHPVAGSHRCGYVAWSPDGQAIYFSSNRGGSTQIWKIAPGGGDAVRVTTQGGRVPTVSPDGHFLYYLRLVSAAGDNSLFRVPLAGGAEEKTLEFVDAYSISSAGIAFKYYRSGTNPEGPDLRFLRFETGQTELLPPLSKPLRYGIATSPNGRDLIYSQADYEVSDLMVVEGLH